MVIEKQTCKLLSVSAPGEKATEVFLAGWNRNFEIAR
jgi:hypothetical protein